MHTQHMFSKMYVLYNIAPYIITSTDSKHMASVSKILTNLDTKTPSFIQNYDLIIRVYIFDIINLR